LKEYLLKMGLDEVEITQRSRDGGVDLTAIRKGVGDFSDIDITHYYIQAKRYALKSKIGVRAIRELKGTIPFGYKGMMITTSDFTNDAIAESSNDPSKPIVIINGKSLVISCIDNEIGFIFKPIFSNTQMDVFVNKELIEQTQNSELGQSLDSEFIEKTITANDIRARIISIPSSIMRKFKEDQKSTDVIVNEHSKHTFSIVRGRNYFGGVTDFFRDNNLLSNDGVICPKLCKWLFDDENKLVKLYIEE